jgi:hypothetical protein
MCNCGGGARRRAVTAGGGSRAAVARPAGPVSPASPRVPVRRAPARLFNGMPIVEPRIWGPSMWLILHGLAEIAASDADWPALLTALQTSLPCPDCTAHYSTWYRRHPVARYSGGVRRWLLDLHNDVNRRRGASRWAENQLAETYGVAAATIRERIAGLRDVCGAAALDVATRMLDRVAPAPVPVLDISEGVSV